MPHPGRDQRRDCKANSDREVENASEAFNVHRRWFAPPSAVCEEEGFFIKASTAKLRAASAPLHSPRARLSDMKMVSAWQVRTRSAPGPLQAFGAPTSLTTSRRALGMQSGGSEMRIALMTATRYLPFELWQLVSKHCTCDALFILARLSMECARAAKNTLQARQALLFDPFGLTSGYDIDNRFCYHQRGMEAR